MSTMFGSEQPFSNGLNLPLHQGGLQKLMDEVQQRPDSCPPNLDQIAALGKVPERGWTPLGTQPIGDGLRDQLKSDIRIDEDQAKFYSDALHQYQVPAQLDQRTVYSELEQLWKGQPSATPNPPSLSSNAVANNSNLFSCPSAPHPQHLDSGLAGVQRGVSRNTVAEDLLALTGQLSGLGIADSKSPLGGAGVLNGQQLAGVAAALVAAMQGGGLGPSPTPPLRPQSAGVPGLAGLPTGGAPSIGSSTPGPEQLLGANGLNGLNGLAQQPLGQVAQHLQQQQQQQQQHLAQQGLGLGGAPAGLGGVDLQQLAAQYQVYQALLLQQQQQQLLAAPLNQLQLGGFGGAGVGGLPQGLQYPGMQAYPSPAVLAAAAAALAGTAQVADGRDGEGRGKGRGGKGRRVEEEGGQCRFNKVDDVLGQVVAVSQDQNGCRFLQKKFDEQGQAAVQKVFPEILEAVDSMMMDPFGNYLVQKLLDIATSQQRLQIVQRITAGREIASVAVNTHGTRAVQKLVETLDRQEQVELVIEALQPSCVELIKDLNGNHVIQRCLQKLQPANCQFIFDAANERCVDIATHRHGCCVLQRCIDHATPDQKAKLVEQVVQHGLQLAQDAFGNYVVQYVLDMKDSSAADRILQQLRGNFPDLSTQKFSSNVVEKCLKMSKPELEHWKHIICTEIITSPFLARILQDAYGNYVVQSALAVSSGQQHQQLVDAIKPYLPSLRGTPHGKRILQKVNSRF